MCNKDKINNKSITYFKIIGDFEPSEITKALNLSPSRTWKKGEERKYLDRRGNGNYKFSLWEFGRIESVNNNFINNQTYTTIIPLLDCVDLLKELKQKYKLTFVLEIVPKFYTITDKPIISPSKEVIEFCYLTETKIDIDYYFYFFNDNLE